MRGVFYNKVPFHFNRKFSSWYDALLSGTKETTHLALIFSYFNFKTDSFLLLEEVLYIHNKSFQLQLTYTSFHLFRNQNNPSNLHDRIDLKTKKTVMTERIENELPDSTTTFPICRRARAFPRNRTFRFLEWKEVFGSSIITSGFFGISGFRCLISRCEEGWDLKGKQMRMVCKHGL